MALAGLLLSRQGTFAEINVAYGAFKYATLDLHVTHLWECN